MHVPDAAIGAVVAAMIAGIISLLGLIISKEQKTSEFRQSWVDALRSDLSTYLTQINSINDATKIKYPSHTEKVKLLSPYYAALNLSTFNIILRINPSENKSKRLLKALSNFNTITANEENLNNENIRLAEQEFLAASQDLLRYEWRRVKSGEWTFQLAKIVALIVVVGAILISVFLGFKGRAIGLHQAPVAVLAPSENIKTGPKSEIITGSAPQAVVGKK